MRGGFSILNTKYIPKHSNVSWNAMMFLGKGKIIYTLNTFRTVSVVRSAIFSKEIFFSSAIFLATSCT